MSAKWRRILAGGVVSLLLTVVAVRNANAQTRVQVTNTDVRLVQENIRSAQASFQQTWKNIFSSLGQNPPAPRVIAFDTAVMTGCGMVKKDNGYFCDADKSIYLDAEFLAGEMKSTGKALGTDGDYGAIVIAAHEYGHAIAHQLRLTYPNDPSTQVYADEQTADCFAGVITHQEKLFKHLQPDDFEEGLYSISMAGDDRIAGIDYDSLSLRDAIQYILTVPTSHGHAGQREIAYVSGYFGGMSACARTLSGAGWFPAGRTLYDLHYGTPSQSAGKIAGRCIVSGIPGGINVKDVSYSDDYCLLSELSSVGNPLPADFRVEVDTTLFVPRITTPRTPLRPWAVFIFWMARRPQAGQKLGIT